jgi:hypothetical protein
MTALRHKMIKVMRLQNLKYLDHKIDPATIN